MRSVMMRTAAATGFAAVLAGLVGSGACSAGGRADQFGGGGRDGGGEGVDGSSTGGMSELADSGEPEPDPENSVCGGEEHMAETRVINIMLVVDRSSSMNTAAGRGTRWSILQEALGTTLVKIAGRVPFGLTLFPSVGETCAVAEGEDAINVGVDLGTLPDILTTLADNPPQATGGGTPTSAALDRVYEYFTAGSGAAIEGSKLVILATDGGPITCAPGYTHADWEGPGCPMDQCVRNWEGDCPLGDSANCCEDNGLSCLDEGTASVVMKLEQAQVPVYVIGITSAEGELTLGGQMLELMLDDFAIRGGTARSPTQEAPYAYYRATDQGGLDELSTIFNSIAGELLTECQIELVSGPPDIEKVNLYVNGQAVPQNGADGEDNDADGWELEPNSTDAKWLIIKGVDCDIVRQGVESIEVRYGCPTVVIL